MFKKIIFCVTIIAVLASSLFFSVGASSMVYDENDFKYLNFDAPIKSILVENPTDYSFNDNTASAIQYIGIGADTRFSQIDINDGKALQQLAYLNYPYQTNPPYQLLQGYAVAYKTQLETQDISVGYTPTGTPYASIGFPTQPVDYSYDVPSYAVERCALSGSSITFAFDDFVSSSNKPGYFAFDLWKLRGDLFATGVSVVLEWDYQYLSIDGTFKTAHRKTSTQHFLFEETAGGVYRCYVRTDLNFPTPTDAKIDKFIVSNFKIRLSNFLATGERLSQAFLASTCEVNDTDNPSSDDVYEYIQENVHNIVRGLGDYSFTEWLETAVGGFLDFEFVQGVSLGGVILVMLGVGILMLLIRIFKG